MMGQRWECELNPELGKEGTGLDPVVGCCVGLNWVHLPTPNSVLSGICESSLISNSIFRCNQWRRNHTGLKFSITEFYWALIQYYWYPYKRREIWTQKLCEDRDICVMMEERLDLRSYKLRNARYWLVITRHWEETKKAPTLEPSWSRSNFDFELLAFWTVR
jgi:hypothetical protein